MVNAITVVWVRLPLVPVTVTLVVPVVAVAEAVKVSTLLLPVAEAGLKLAVTPAGRALLVKATAPVNPPVRVMLMVLLPLAPWATESVAGAAARLKSGPWVMVSATVVVWERLPLVPVTVTLVVPVAAVAEAVKVSTLLLPVAEAGLKLAVTPVGRALVVKATAPVKPFRRVMLMVLLPLAPWATESVAGAAASEKSGF